MQLIDSQVHCFAASQPDLPWAVESVPLYESDGADMIAAMAAVGVAGAIMVSPFSVYHYDRRFAEALGRSHAARFGLVVPVDPTLPDLDDSIAEWATVPGAVGIRLLLPPAGQVDPATGEGLLRAIAAACRHGLAVNLMGTANLSLVHELAVRNSDAQLVLDHLGLPVPFDAVPVAPFAALPEVLALARYPNLAIKVSGACALSHEAYPFEDIWPQLSRVLDAFGLERCMWGTDWTRTVALLSYREAVDSFRLNPRLSMTDRAMLMGEALQRIYRWAPTAPDPAGRER
jgi:predicted TIM-barrel fold metal-dependent hydrolase